jgi:hypothetical protein
MRPSRLPQHPAIQRVDLREVHEGLLPQTGASGSNLDYTWIALAPRTLVVRKATITVRIALSLSLLADTMTAGLR